MQNGGGVRQLAHQPTRAARMVEVNVRQQNVLDGRARDAERFQRSQQIGHRVIRADVDECSAAAVLNDVGRRVSWMQVLGIDGRDSIRMPEESRGGWRCGTLWHAG
jgi:hypothetical protein